MEQADYDALKEKLWKFMVRAEPCVCCVSAVHGCHATPALLYCAAAVVGCRCC
jgi:hypothetical protein